MSNADGNNAYAQAGCGLAGCGCFLIVAGILFPFVFLGIAFILSLSADSTPKKASPPDPPPAKKALHRGL